MTKRALLISLQGIGNTVLIAPAVRLLAETGFQIDLVVSDNGSHEILRESPYVNQQHVWIERDGWLRNLLRLRSKLRLVEYDNAYALYPNGRRENALLSLVRASRKKCYVDPKHYYQFLNFLPFSDKLDIHKQHDAASNIALVSNGNSQSHNGGSGLNLSRAAEEFADEFYKSHGLENKFVVSVHPGGGNSAKQWSPENYRELCAKLATDESVRLLVFGAKSEARLVDGITRQLGERAIAVCGLELAKLTAVLQKSRLLIGNDSALIHIASAFDIPVVAIWGYTDFQRTAPFNSQGIVVRINYACSPCYDFASGYIDDCQYHLKCIKNISADTVHRIVAKYMEVLTSGRAFDAQQFAAEPFVESIEQLAGRCVMINVQAAAEKTRSVA